MPHCQAIQITKLLAIFCVLWFAPKLALADRLEFLNGAALDGTVTGRDAQSITIKIELNGQVFSRKYPVERIKAVTIGGKREELTGGAQSATPAQPQPAAPASPQAAPAAPAPAPPAAGQKVQRTKAEIEALIAQQGGAAPDWWEATPLEYPQTLDLAWPEPAPGPWNAKRNVGQYLWEVIQPNPNRWHSGIRFVHYMLAYHKANPQKQLKIMNTLGRLYFQLLEDYARAAFWWRKAGVEQSNDFWSSAVSLAECYWRLGNKDMALDRLNRCEVQLGMIKLLGDMGETQAALKLVNDVDWGDQSASAMLGAGDACRVVRDYDRALQYFQKAIQFAPQARNAQYAARIRRMAQANIDGIKAFQLLDLKRVPDGAYVAGSQGYEAEVKVEVVVKGGRIESVRVIQHREKQFYSAMNETPRKIIARQGVTGIDATSQATMTSEAIVNATAKALVGAMK